MMIIDFHAHLDRDPITKKYKVQELLTDMDNNGIDKRVISTYFGKDISAANDKIIETVRLYPDRLIGCAVINPKNDDSIEEMRRISQYQEIKIVEFNSLEHGYRPEKFQYNLDPIFEIIREKGLIVKVFTGAGFYTMPDQWAFYSRRFPEITFVIECMAGEDFRYGTVDLMNEEANLMMETSNETEIPALNKIFKNVSHERLMYGSNYPDNFTKLSIMKFDDMELSEDSKRKIFSENAKKLLNI